MSLLSKQSPISLVNWNAEKSMNDRYMRHYNTSTEKKISHSTVSKIVRKEVKSLENNYVTSSQINIPISSLQFNVHFVMFYYSIEDESPYFVYSQMTYSQYSLWNMNQGTLTKHKLSTEIGAYKWLRNKMCDMYMYAYIHELSWKRWLDISSTHMCWLIKFRFIWPYKLFNLNL